jgi:hypothetical protein
MERHTSQHVFDPYSLTHVLHGILFFWLTNLLFRRLSLSSQFSLAILAEAAWEILENSNAVIEHYRQTRLRSIISAIRFLIQSATFSPAPPDFSSPANSAGSARSRCFC